MLERSVGGFNSDLDYLNNAIINAVSTGSTNSEFQIVVDGKYYNKTVKTELADGSSKYSGSKKVYVRYNNRNLKGVPSQTVLFYVKAGDGGVTFIKTAVEEILEKINQPKFQGISVDGYVSIDSTSIRLCTVMNMIIIKSHSYMLAEEATKHFDKGSAQNGLSLGTLAVPREKMVLLTARFKEYSIASNVDIIYNRHSNRFINLIYREDKFLEIAKAFIPVFIKYDLLYNPMLEDRTFLIERNPVYKKALEINRKINVMQAERTVISCYMLTHKEICEALGMTRFMRFTPLFIFKLMVGLSRPDLEDYPSTTRNVYLKVSGKTTLGKPKYSVNEFVKLYTEQSNIVKTSKNQEEVANASAIIQELETYMKVDTLYYHVHYDRDKLISIGSNYLDNRSKLKVSQLTEYLREARF